jgi:hypothetical protein
MQSVWFHGTSEKNALSIEREGFRTGTWFARHMEDAVAFGGPIVMFVKVTFDKAPMRWQVCSSNAIPATAIIRKVRTSDHAT